MKVCETLNLKGEIMKRLKAILAVALMIMPGIFSAGTVHADEDGRTYEVTVTNITRGQVITPPVVISHMNSFKLFKVGMPASPELATLAEDGDAAPLLAYLGTQDKVLEYATATTPLLPGESVTLTINSKRRYKDFSVVGMLASTNDAFFAVSGVKLPRHGSIVIMTPAYDAGSEANTELCEHIPGPPCGNHARMTDGAEGYVHIHAGIHGVGDLDPAMQDWRNPVARVIVKQAE